MSPSMALSERQRVCVVALAELFRGDGEIMASPMGPLPALGARLAKATFEPALVLTDGVASAVDPDGNVEHWMPYRSVFDVLWSGKRHVLMGASQVDRFGNQNIACLGDPAKPKVQLLGFRGAPGNTINHTTSYWIPKHSRRVLVEAVDVVSGVGYDRVRDLGAAARFHEIRAVVTNLCVFDFQTPDGSARLKSLHPGVSLDDVQESTGFAFAVPDGGAPVSRAPTAEEDAVLDRLTGKV